MKKPFTQLKRDLRKGVKVKTIKNIFKPENEGQEREIEIVQTNAIAFATESGRPSWLWWKKASNYEYEDNSIKVFEDIKGEKTLVFEYEIIR